MTAQLKLRHRLIYFLGIGGAAAFVHLFTVFNLVKFMHVQALVANVLAFLIAFNVSFLGHKYLTFSQLRDEKNLSLPHFFLVAASAGIINEMLYFLLLRYTTLNYLFALFLVLGFVSVYSFLISKFWACR
ncbi:TPA: GtrA family protein [Legionella anisa]